ncbi:hypothetical protein C8R46DRAFT_1216455 [Mycena filopes]|nr:hypothetical protein C8R46DRAFT_1216455 [Mycena filopes]
MSSRTSASLSPPPASASAPIVSAPAKAPKKTAATKAKVVKPAVQKKKVAATKAHPTECIVATGGRKGVSRSAIKKYADEQYNLNTTAHISQLNRAIATGVEAGTFVLPKGPSGTVKLAPSAPRESKENAKPVSKSTKPASKSATKPVVKKPAAKKATATKVKTAAKSATKKATVAKPRSKKVAA